VTGGLTSPVIFFAHLFLKKRVYPVGVAKIFAASRRIRFGKGAMAGWKKNIGRQGVRQKRGRNWISLGSARFLRPISVFCRWDSGTRPATRTFFRLSLVSEIILSDSQAGDFITSGARLEWPPRAN